MIDLIVSWVAGIVFATLFATFLELLLPSSNMQKFVRVIMGLLIMLAILNPVIGVLERPPDASEVTALAPRATNAAAVQEAAKAAAQKREQLVKEVYRRDLAKQMQSLVMGIEGVAMANVTVECSDGQDGLVRIRQVTVSVRPGKIKSVEKVRIGASLPEPTLPDTIAAKIVQRLGELYQLQSDQITVKLAAG